MAHPNNVRDVFELGRSSFVNASVSRAGDIANIRLSVSNTDQNTMAPGNLLNTTNVALRGGVDMTERLRATGSLNYMYRKGKNRPGLGYSDDNIMQQFVWFGRQVNMKALKARAHDPDNTQRSWSSNYHENPYWMQLVNGNEDHRDRLFGSVDLTYDLVDWVSATFRVGQDYMNDNVLRK